jgi:DNA-binding transcriptional LysR family regulator
LAKSGRSARRQIACAWLKPALSRQIKLLEAEIGRDPFVRFGRGVHLTEAGQEVLKRVSGLVLQLERSV